MTWTNLTTSQKTHLIASVWREGISASEIASAIGVTKNVISGHYSRNRDELALFPLSGKAGTKAVAKPKPAPAPKPKKRAKTVRIKPKEYGLFVMLEDCDGCTWPLNDGGPYLFCGHAKFGKYAYCEHHHERSRGRGTISERAAHRGVETHV